jgi:hypothetical protein
MAAEVFAALRELTRQMRPIKMADGTAGTTVANENDRVGFGHEKSTELVSATDSQAGAASDNCGRGGDRAVWHD